MMIKNKTFTALDDEDEVKAENGWDWWMVLSVVALGVIIWQISDAAMTSIFDEEDE